MLKVKIKDIKFNSPIIAASGTYGYGDEFDSFVDLNKIGCIITKSITIEERKGNASPRIHESGSGMINSIGLANMGVKKFCKLKLDKLNKIKTKFIISIAGSKIQDYIDVVSEIEKCNGFHVGYEINISCPNVKKGGMEFGNDPEMSAQVVEACKGVTSKPIITKLSPNQADIKESARKCINAGSDALSVINTITGMAIDIDSKRPVLGNTSGGLSGPAIKPIALQKVMQVYEVAGPQNIPIMGQGGISSVKDALEFIIAGASTIGIGTALFIDPLVCNKINEGIENYLSAQGLDGVESLVGSLIKD